LRARAFPLVHLSVLAIWFTIALTLQLFAPLWWDELYTYERYIAQGPITVITSDYHSNNHRLYSFLAAVIVKPFGASEAVLRLPAVIPTAASAWLLGSGLRRWHGDVPAIAGMLLFCFSPLLLVWTPQARGYGLAVLASTVLLVSAHELATDSGPRLAGRWLVALAVSTAVGIATLPHFVLVAAFTWLAVMITRGRAAWHWSALVAMGTAVVAGAAIYVPGLPGHFGDLTSGTRGKGMALVDAIAGPFRFLVEGRSWGGPMRELVGPFAGLVTSAVAVLVLAGLVEGLRRRAMRPSALVLGLPVFGIFTLFAVRQVAIVDRTLLFLLPQLALGVALGVAAIMQLVRDRGWRREWMRPVALGVLTMTIIAAVGAGGVMLSAWLRAPIEDYRLAVRTVLSEPGFEPVTDTRYVMGIAHYDKAGGIMRLSSEEVDALLCNDLGGSFAYLYQPIGRREPPPENCMTARGAFSVRIPQRHRGYFEVWFVP